MTRPNEPQSCYPDEIETLRELIEEQNRKLAIRGSTPMSPAIEMFRRRIEALKTAIEALGGAL